MMRQACSLSVHDDTFSAADVLLNLALLPRDHSIIAGNLLRLVPSNHPQHTRDAQQVENHDMSPKQTHNASRMSKHFVKTEDDRADNGTSKDEHPIDYKKGYHFMAKEMDSEQSSKLAGVQVNYPSTSYDSQMEGINS